MKRAKAHWRAHGPSKTRSSGELRHKKRTSFLRGGLARRSRGDALSQSQWRTKFRLGFQTRRELAKSSRHPRLIRPTRPKRYASISRHFGTIAPAGPPDSAPSFPKTSGQGAIPFRHANTISSLPRGPRHRDRRGQERGDAPERCVTSSMIAVRVSRRSICRKARMSSAPSSGEARSSCALGFRLPILEPRALTTGLKIAGNSVFAIPRPLPLEHSRMRPNSLLA